MRSSVSIYVAFILPATLSLAIPLSKPDASPITQQNRGQEEHQDFIRRMLYVDGIASELEPKEKRDPSSSTAAPDTTPATNSLALDSPFAATHNMGHGPAVRPLTSSTAAPPSSTDAVSAGSTPEAVPNVVNTHSDNRNHTYLPVNPSSNGTHQTHSNATEQKYQCNSILPLENLTAILISGRPQDEPGCKLINNITADANQTSSVPEQNKNNPAYIGGGEAAAPPGYHVTPDNMTTSIPAGENSTLIDVNYSQYTNGTEITTLTVTEKVKGEQADGSGMSGIGVGGSPIGNSSTSTDTPDNPPTTDMGDMPTSTEAPAPASTGKGKTPYALPPGFTGP